MGMEWNDDEDLSDCDTSDDAGVFYVSKAVLDKLKGQLQGDIAPDRQTVEGLVDIDGLADDDLVLPVSAMT